MTYLVESIKHRYPDANLFVLQNGLNYYVDQPHIASKLKDIKQL
jgi:hypothetical protein